MSRNAIRILFRGRVHELDGRQARMTLLDWLRLEQRAVGTKEGCAEGDCGACTVVLARLDGACVRYEAVNACILLAGQCDGAGVLTVEDLGRPEGRLHPVQEAMVERHGSQCGFCTPGIVMSLYAQHQGGVRPLTRQAVLDQLAGNLCRCTGYRPIVAAALQAAAEPATDDACLADQLRDLQRDGTGDLLAGDDNAFFAAPASEAALQQLLARFPQALLVAGGTDAGLWLTKALLAPRQVIWLGRVAGLDAIARDDGRLVLGATVPLARAMPELAALDHDLGEVMRRFGSVQVRNSGTVGGNIANASPIGDLAPCLIALGATLELGSAAGVRTLPLERYFLAYKQQDRRPGEYVRRLIVPVLADGRRFRASKVSKRADEDISAVLGAFAIDLGDGRISAARVAFGGMAGVPARAHRCEVALVGVRLADPATWQGAIAALAEDFDPIDDHRASAAYRRLVAGNLLRKTLMRMGGDEASISLAATTSSSHGGGSATASDAMPAAVTTRVVHHSLAHESARLHVAGAAAYIDDLREPAGTLHVACGLSPAARGRITALDLAPVRAAPGVVAVLTPAEVAGVNDIAPHAKDEPLLAEGTVMFHGQPLFAVVAETREAARRAARLARIAIAEDTPILTIEQALAAGSRIQPDYHFARGDAGAAIASAPRQLEGRLRIGGQEHFYLEGQIALAVPGEQGAMTVYASTQDPAEVQHIVARVLGVPDAAVVVETRRMGGGFGGKESQACQWAALAALAAQVTGRPCKLRLDRDDDFALTGKRHEFRADWRVGFTPEGALVGYDMTLNAGCGCSLDLSPGVVDRAMFHASNCYYAPAVRIDSRRLKTNTVSSTAFRGFGGPQGMLACERVMDAVAHATGRDPLDVRKANLYAPGRDLTPYNFRVDEAELLAGLIGELERSSDYRARRADIAAFNRASRWLKKGIALTPVQFGLSFTLVHLNQAGALVHVYQDGSILLGHGGTEMGQGLFVKVAQVVAEEFGVPLSHVRPAATSTAMVPNAAPTAASAGSDLNGMAAQIAARAIKGRMAAVAAEMWKVPAEDVMFGDGRVTAGNHAIAFGDLALAARRARVQLSEAGFYRTPELDWNREQRSGRPFYYFTFGAACSEVAIDTLTGETRVTRADLLQDAGHSLNPAIDIGQVEGAFVQGMGWLTTEELVWDGKGRLATHAPSTYKIPVAADVPADLRVSLRPGANRKPTIYRSKGIGEPPLMLAISVFSAIIDALHAIAPGSQVPLDAPATPERIALAAAALHSKNGG